MHRILLIDGSMDSQLEVRDALSSADIALSFASTALEALQKLSIRPVQYDLIISDFALPDSNGLTVLNYIKKNKENEICEIPMIFLTCRKEIESKVSAFSLGADDYLVKPLDPIELQARLEVRIRKAGGKRPPPQIIKKKSLTLNIPLMKASIQHDNISRPLDLTTKEFKILAFLVENEGEVHPRAKLLKIIWGENNHVQARTVDSHICSLRKKMDRYGRYIECIPGAGYRFIAETGS